jgi:hypothetical protein
VDTNSEDVFRAREEVLKLESARLRLSEKVMKGDAEALEDDRRLERRIRELANQWTLGQEEEDR